MLTEVVGDEGVSIKGVLGPLTIDQYPLPKTAGSAERLTVEFPQVPIESNVIFATDAESDTKTATVSFEIQAPLVMV